MATKVPSCSGCTTTQMLTAAAFACLLLATGSLVAEANDRSAGGPTPASFGDPIGASLTVDNPLRNQTKSIGEKVKLDCEITGYPTPRYTWFKDEQEISIDAERVPPSSQRYKVQQQDWGSRLLIDRTVANDAGVYRCMASNPRGSVETAATLRLRPATAGAGPTSPSSAAAAVRQSTVAIDQILSPSITDEDSDDDDVSPYCQGYKGTYCGFLKDRQIYVTSRKSQHLADQRIMRMVNELGQPALGNRHCYTQALEAVCHHQMPLCAYDGHQRAYPRRLCKSECEDIVASCRAEFASSPKAWRLLPNCAELSELDGCIRLSDSQSVRGDDTKDTATAGDKEVQSKEVPYVIIIPSVVGGIVIIVVVAAICIRKQRAGRKKSGVARHRKSKSAVEESDNTITGKDRDGKMQEMLLLSRNGSSTGGSSSDRVQPPQQQQQVPYVKDVAVGNIHFVEELGEGQFGKIFRAQVFGLYGTGTATTALVKTLHASTAATAPALALAFRREIDDVVELRHQHVALLLGVSLQGSPQCALYEHLPLGDLKQFLLSRAPSPPPLQLAAIKDGSGGGSMDSGPLYIGAAASAGLQTPELLYVAAQVASALEYLAAARRKHGDVAARNVLVGQNLSIKLSNLSVSRGPYAADYCPLHERLMPVRWLPPEVVTYGQPSHEADVYSFGVLLWELFTFGQQPYAGHGNHEVIELVRSRHLLTCPPAAPTRLYSLMVECWHEAPAKRPTARELHQKLRTWYMDAASAPPIVGPRAPADGAGATMGGKPSSKSGSSAGSSAGSSVGTPSVRGGSYTMHAHRLGIGGRGGGATDVGADSGVALDASTALSSTGSRGGGGSGGCFDGSTMPLLLQQQPPTPTTPLCTASGGSAMVPSYYSQPMPYIACCPTTTSGPSSSGGGFGFDKPAPSPIEKGDASNEAVTPSALSPLLLSAPANNLAAAVHSYVETQVDFPQRRGMMENDFV